MGDSATLVHNIVLHKRRARQVAVQVTHAKEALARMRGEDVVAQCLSWKRALDVVERADRALQQLQGPVLVQVLRHHKSRWAWVDQEALDKNPDTYVKDPGVRDQLLLSWRNEGERPDAPFGVVPGFGDPPGPCGDGPFVTVADHDDYDSALTKARLVRRLAGVRAARDIADIVTNLSQDATQLQRAIEESEAELSTLLGRIASDEAALTARAGLREQDAPEVADALFALASSPRTA